MNVVNVVPMPSTPPPATPSQHHVSVLCDEVVRLIGPGQGALVVDATVGAGGHAEALLEGSGARLIGLDRDPRALAIAKERLARFGSRARLVHARFGELERVLGEEGIGEVDGILADIGLSSMQLDDPGRGMSFRHEGPIDMRMDPSRGETALDLIASLDDDELADVLYRYGEERRSRRVARCIRQAYERGELATTHDLRRAVVRAVGPARVGGVDPATRTFQALRVAVNQELTELSTLLEAAKRVLAPGGIIAIISFHSLEDRLVKIAFRDDAAFEPLTKKPLVAGEVEVADNPRARSAKLRAARRVEEVVC